MNVTHRRGAGICLVVLLQALHVSPQTPPPPASCAQTLNGLLYTVAIVYTGLGTPCDPNNAPIYLYEVEVSGAGAAAGRHGADALPAHPHACMHVGCATAYGRNSDSLTSSISDQVIAQGRSERPALH